MRNLILFNIAILLSLQHTVPDDVVQSASSALMVKIAANPLKAYRTSTTLMFLIVLLKCQYLIV